MNSPATGGPGIIGPVRAGETLTATMDDIEDEDGLTAAVFAYQWVRSGTDIDEATSFTYTVTDDDEGKAIKVRVTFTDDDGNEGFGQIFPRFNEKLLRLGLLSRQMYADSNLLRANVSGRNLSPSSMSVEEFKDKAVEENGLFVLREWKVEDGGEEKRACRRLRLNFAVCEASGDSYAIYGYIDDGLAYKMCLSASLSPINSPEEPDARKYSKRLYFLC